ncbi:hypothetical protein U1Q18_010512, partial [Sarracenia purpurea var. burkii]
FLLSNVEVSVSNFGNDPTIGKVPICEASADNDGNIGCTNDVGHDTVDGTFRFGSISGCCDDNPEHTSFDTFRPDLMTICDYGNPEHVDFDTLGTGTSSIFVHNDDVNENAGIDNLRFDNSDLVHDVAATETEFNMSGYDVAKPTVPPNTVHPTVTISK